MTAAKYLRICNLAQGGMGTVDLVVRREGAFARVYAMKRLLPNLASDADLRAMFLDEARIAGLIRHSNVVSVLDVGEDENGPFLVMDFVEGVSLSTLMKTLHDRREPIPLAAALAIAIQIVTGLHAAHELSGPGGRALRVIHRDVSPQNVLVGSDGCVRVTDFGVARALGRATQTSTGVLKGKFGYMTPEQLRFEEVDARSDLFSFGVVLYELIVGRRLYAGEQSQVFRRITAEPPPDAGELREDLPPALVALLFELLAKDRERRPSDGRTVARRLEAILRDVSAEQGALNLAEFIGDHFADEVNKQKGMIASALEASRALDAPTEQRGTADLHEISTNLLGKTRTGSTEVVSTAVYDRGRRGSRGTIAWIGLALLIGALGAGIGVWAIGSQRDDSPPPPVASPMPVLSEVEGPASPAVPVAPPPAQAAPVAPVVEPSVPAVAEPPPQADDDPAPRRRGRRGRNLSGVPVWDDY